MLLPGQGFFAECSAPSTAAQSGAEGTRWHQAPRQRGERRCQAPACALSSGRWRGISSSLTACSAKTLARGRGLVTAAVKECVERGNKNEETWKTSLAKRDKHTHDTQIIAAASQPAGKRHRAVISGFFCQICNIQKWA